MDYDKLLEKGIKELPSISQEKDRFEIPKVKGHIEGNKTILINFTQIASTLRRDPDHLLKFLLRELATPGNLDEKRLVLGRKISSSQINEKIESYAKIFVLCKECGKPDTQIMKEGKANILRCTACGARHIIKTKI
ncbi:MAG: translation initiation factor IF-2 subunit beta [Nanoarchaeota archaeon]|nr:translation initiation factor IF-2 subunit beta [Nanoarchaeota archaeon]|tara:strand:- start:270 stop:677 length:408 start_codon:yes stop_codon:yes gene_type:complete